MRSPDDWWDALDPVFEEAFSGCGLPPELAATLAREVRAVYIDIAAWTLYEETKEVLADLSREGWSHAVLSNHVPELPSLIRGLGLGPFIGPIINSAQTGVEKPHPWAFQSALKALGNPSKVWMIGDNIEADFNGAESAGLRAILVRSEDSRASRCAKDLRGVRKFVNE